jgi:hypothetical protein
LTKCSSATLLMASFWRRFFKQSIRKLLKNETENFQIRSLRTFC